MTKGKVVLVPFPFDDLSSSKVRPVVCLTNPIGPHRHVIVAFITSRVPSEPLPTNLIIDQHNSVFAQTGLRVASTLQLHRMLTITTAIIQRELGTLPATLQADIDQRLLQVFELE